MIILTFNYLINVHSTTALVRTREFSEKYGLFSEACSSALGSPISNWTTHVGPPVHGLNTLFCKPPCETSVRATNARKRDDNIAN